MKLSFLFPLSFVSKIITCSPDILIYLYEYNSCFKVGFLKHIFFVKMGSDTNLTYWSLHKKDFAKNLNCVTKTTTYQNIFPCCYILSERKNEKKEENEGFFDAWNYSMHPKIMLGWEKIFLWSKVPNNSVAVVTKFFREPVKRAIEWKNQKHALC